VLFDMGNTLVGYFDRAGFRPVLRQAIGEVASYLAGRLGVSVDPEALDARVAEENHESPDFRVRPLADRLRRIFGLGAEPLADDVTDGACRAFLGPVFAVGRVYDDTLPALERLRVMGLRTGLVSNAPWGSPAPPWHEELARLGLACHLEAIVFCTDVGWRKPDPRPFLRCLELVGVPPAEALFVGDEPRWDVEGPASIGMPAVLIARGDSAAPSGAISCLGELVSRLGC
jgi:putative hydrolase of the HAD superfamily